MADFTKRLFLLLLLCTGIGLGTAKAMSYAEARDQAWFLTDKMAYELNLTSAQYDAVYQINLDYLMSIDRASDCYGIYWTYRDDDLSCILFDWQYALYATLDYFYRPIRWLHSAWYYPVFDRYRRGYYYFNRPTVFVSYRGGMWRRRGHNDVSPYRNMAFRQGRGMRDGLVRAGAPVHRPEYGRSGIMGDRQIQTPRGAQGGRSGYTPNNGRNDNRTRPVDNATGQSRNNGSQRTDTQRRNSGNGTYSRPGTSDRQSSRTSNRSSSSRQSGTTSSSRQSGKSSSSTGSSRTFGNR